MAEDKTQQLKEKYVAAISVLNREDFRIQNVHAEGDKLVIRAEAPSQQASNHFWDAVKRIDANYAKDLNAQISVRPQQQAAQKAPPQQQPGVTPVGGTKESAAQGAATTYTVEKGDTLSKISKQFYGDANQYMKIFEANRDQLKDPDQIQIGQVLKIPGAETKREA